MKFEESGLPNNSKLVRDAFEFSYNNVQAGRDDMMKDFERQMKQSFDQGLHLLNLDRDDGFVKPEDYPFEKRKLEKMLEEQLRVAPQVIQNEINNTFKQRRIGPAQEANLHAQNVTEEMLAAIILVDCVRSPVDFVNLEKQFGKKVAHYVAQIQHLDIYATERDTLLAKADKDVKAIYMALLVTTLDGILAHVKLMAQINPAQKVAFYEGQEEILFGNACSLWGNDKRLDQRFLQIFNKTAEATSSLFRMEVDAAGTLELVKGATVRKSNNKIPPKPPNNGKSGIGDIVW